MTAFPDAIRGVEVDAARNEVTARVAAARIVDVARWLHDTPEAAFDHITDICSVDYPNDTERFEVIYQLLSIPHRRRIRLKARITEESPEIASVTGIWKGAEFMEREVYDLMGITFTGHPDLRRILLPEDYEKAIPCEKTFRPKGEAGAARFRSFPAWTKPLRNRPRVKFPRRKSRSIGQPTRRAERGGAKNCS